MNIRILIEKLFSTNESWETYLIDDELYYKRLKSANYTDDVKELINQLVDALYLERRESAKQEEEAWNQLRELNVQEETIGILKEFGKGKIQVYRNVEVLRKNPDKALRVLTDVFDQLSVSYNPDMLTSAQNYEIEEEDAFKIAVLQIDGIISTHIRRHYDKKAAMTDFAQVTGLGENCELLYGELYEKNLMKIQMNLMLDKLEEILGRLDEQSDSSQY